MLLLIDYIWSMSWGKSIIDTIENNNYLYTTLPSDYLKKKCAELAKVKKRRKAINVACVEYPIEEVGNLPDDKYFEALRKKYSKSKIKGYAKDDKGWSMYRKKVWVITEIAAKSLSGIEKRGFKDHHIDHIVPIYYGFKYGIPVDLIGSAENLEMMHYKENMIKAFRLSRKSLSLLKKWGYEISKYQKSETKPYQNSKSIRIQKCEQLSMLVGTHKDNERVG